MESVRRRCKEHESRMQIMAHMKGMLCSLRART